MNKILVKVMNLFQAKRIRFAEDANFMISMLKNVPKFGNRYTDEWFGKTKQKAKIKYGMMVAIGRLLVEFIKKLIYVLIFVYLPYRVIGKYCPNILYYQEKSVLFFFVVMTSICGSIVNNTLFAMTDRDYLMLRVMQITDNMYYTERILSKMISEIICYTIILNLLGVGIGYSIAVGIFTMAMRPIGECCSLLIHDHWRKAFVARGTINGLMMAAAVIYAYVITYFNRSISNVWYIVGNPIFVIVFVLVGAGAMAFLYRYDRYEEIEREAVYLRRED